MRDAALHGTELVETEKLTPTYFMPPHGTWCHSSLLAAPEGAHSRGTKRRHRSTYLVRVRVRVRNRARVRARARTRARVRVSIGLGLGLGLLHVHAAGQPGLVPSRPVEQLGGIEFCGLQA